MSKCALIALLELLTVELHLPKNSLQAIITQESSGDTNAVSPKGARGLMQLTPIAIKEVQQNEVKLPGVCQNLTEKNVFKYAESNVKAGACYFSLMLKQFDGDERRALAAYNCGPSCAQGENWPTETKNYVKKVLNYKKNPQILCKKEEK